MLSFGTQDVEWHYGTPIWVSTIRPDKLLPIQEELAVAYNDLLANDKFQHHPTSRSHLLSDATFGGNLFEDYNTTHFKAELEVQLRNYMNSINSGIGTARPFEYKIRGAWMTLNKPGCYAVVHDHGETDVSGVYYFDSNGQDGDIFFETPNKLLKNSYCFKQFGKSWAHKPATGKLILFPGWLEHGVCANHTEHDRVSISFNINFIKNY